MDRTTEAANLIYRKDFDGAIRLLETLDDSAINRNSAAMKHLNLAIAYSKKKDIDQSNFHYHKAIEFEHPTGMAYEKLAINLTKQGKLQEAIEVCQRLIDHPSIPSPHSYLTKDDMRKRKDKLRARLARK